MCSSDLAFAQTWHTTHAAPGGIPVEIADQVLRLLESYGALNERARRQAVNAAIALLDGGNPGPESTPPELAPVATHASTARPATPRAAQSRSPEPPINDDTPLSSLRGVGTVRAKALERLGLTVAGDLLHHYPNRYMFYPPPRRAVDLFFQRQASFEGVVRSVTVAALPRQLKRITARVADSTGVVEAVWLRGGAARSPVHEGQRIALSGPIVSQGRQIIFQNPDCEPADQLPLHTRRIVPVYPLTKGIYDGWLRALVARVVRVLAQRVDDPLPQRHRQNLG